MAAKVGKKQCQIVRVGVFVVLVFYFTQSHALLNSAGSAFSPIMPRKLLRVIELVETTERLEKQKSKYHFGYIGKNMIICRH